MDNYIDLDTAKQDLSDWIINFLDVPQEMLNNIAPCPFAKAALLGQKINFVAGSDNILNDMLVFHHKWDYQFDAVALVYSKDIDAQKFTDCVHEVNTSYYCISGLIALEDHPLIEENIAGINFNNGKYALILIQPASKLKKASEILKRKGYYKNWLQSDLYAVVEWRW
jgi:hypothetical protein